MDLLVLLGLTVKMLALLFALGLVSLLAIPIYRLTFHPLAQVPGPRAAAISNFWQARHVRDGRARELGKTLHKKYGHVVRVGPNEVWFNSGEAFKNIYSMAFCWQYFLPLGFTLANIPEAPGTATRNLVSTVSGNNRPQ